MSEEMEEDMEIISEDMTIEDELESSIDEFSYTEIDEDVLNELNALEKKEEDLKRINEILAADENSKKKPKKIKRPSNPLVQFVKKYFSSLIARTSKYCIFNLDENHKDKLVMMSSRGKITFEDYLLQYTPGDLALQIVEFKNDELSFIKEKLYIPDDKIMLVNIASIRKAVNTALKDKVNINIPLQIVKSSNNNVFMEYKDVTKVDDNGKSTKIIEKICIEYTDWRTICILRYLVNKMEVQNNTDCVVTEKIKYENVKNKIYQNLLIYPIQTIKFKMNDELLYPEFNEKNYTNLVFIDGKDIVSLKEYVKKLKIEYNLEITAIVHLPDKHVFYISVFEDEELKVICSRPFTCMYPFAESSKEFTNVQ